MVDGPLHPITSWFYWQCVDCGRLTATERSLPGICTICGTNCWRSPPLHDLTQEKE